jgi:hypothetical protein
VAFIDLAVGQRLQRTLEAVARGAHDRGMRKVQS